MDLLPCRLSEFNASEHFGKITDLGNNAHNIRGTLKSTYDLFIDLIFVLLSTFSTKKAGSPWHS